MLNLLRTLFSSSNEELSADSTKQDEPAPLEILIEGLAPFPVSEHIKWHNSLPILNWEAAQAWVDTAETDALQNEAWTACERAWLLHLRDALGADYYLAETDKAALLSSLEADMSRATLDYMGRTLQRVVKVLDGIAHVPEWGKDILIVFDDYEHYYNYASYFYPEEGGEFAISGGMHISDGCSHFITVKSDMRTVEPVIAHEMTHGCLSHLPIPLWLNEGLAVNTEHRIAGKGTSLYTPHEMQKKHLSFWGEAEIQEFWSGKSFYRPDDGNLLSYDLARIMVEQMAKDWESFKPFVLNANWNDGGASAAAEYLDIHLGEAVCALLEKPESCRWMPAPEKWGEPEKSSA